MVKNKDIIIPDINQRIKLFRKSIRYSQRELGEATGSDQTTISKYEIGILDPSNEFIRALNKLFNVSYKWIYNGIGNMTVVEVKGNITKDLATIKNSQDQMEYRVKKLESVVNELVRELYAMKNHV